MSQIDKITKDLSLRVQQAVPNAQLGYKGKPLNSQQIQRRLERFYQDAGAVRAQEKLGIFRWARVMLGLREQLLRAGYPSSMVSPLIRSTLFQAARPDLVLAPALTELQAPPETADSATTKASKSANKEMTLERAVALKAQGKRQRALAMVKGVLAKDSQNFEGWVQLADLHVEMDDDESAIESLQRALALRPEAVETHKKLGRVLTRIGEWRRARDSFAQVIRLAPADATAHHDYAMSFISSFDMEQVIESTTEAARLDPTESSHPLLRGFALQELGRFEEATDAFSLAERLKPGLPAALWNLSLQNLLRGDFEAGWRLYEARRKAFPWVIEAQFDKGREWTGEQDLSGKTVVLIGEQGLGDGIQFSRYASLVKAKGARVVLYVDPGLLPVLRQIEGADEVIPFDPQSPPKTDFWVPIMSLPRIFGTKLENIPSPGPYLSSDPAKVATWSAKLGPRRKPRVGLVWSGNPTHPKDVFRTIALEKLLPILPSGFDYFGLQKDLRLPDKEWLRGSGIRFLGPELADFADTAAVCELMDVIVTVDTSVAHLAAAMGRPTWVLVPMVPDWRWLLGREDSPWYQSIRLFRQSDDRQWGPVLERVGRELKARFG
ncbi:MULTISPECIES: tetratricopeptide repeat-containing glycosyltransferase family protein [Ramlibacter]|uniref:Glycosyltransferase family protein n=1 Tax=Ramlibacter aquaticus TaxID=2780094 RepID=A0ABR9SFM7_9BURK|nr:MULTISPECIES: tetratricopeptide repeat-containing glycosyltransferase family protein [Ramlibacter]MBE7941160.1 glycosyltransferase family protein [Ramlibacter aquaticus]